MGMPLENHTDAPLNAPYGRVQRSSYRILSLQRNASKWGVIVKLRRIFQFHEINLAYHNIHRHDESPTFTNSQGTHPATEEEEQ
jgi:hypothetical protein